MACVEIRDDRFLKSDDSLAKLFIHARSYVADVSCRIETTGHDKRLLASTQMHTNTNIGWTPAAILPNLSAAKAVEGDVIAIAPSDDPRIQAFSADHRKCADLLSRFTDAFDVPLSPLVLIVRNDVKAKLSRVDILASFRDLVALCVVPYARALKSVYPKGRHRISYSNWFWLYPWTLGVDNETLVASTPALHGIHAIEQFHGQSSPELPEMEFEIADFDKPLFDALLRRWKRHYLGKRQRWQDRALFRSLNMAFQAAQLPAGIDATFYDVGRIATLWVSAFEILSHPRTRSAGLMTVYPLFEAVSYLNDKVRRRKYAAFMPKKAPRRRGPLPCWLYGKLYIARNDFLHGNPLHRKALNPGGSKVSLFWLAAPLYRLALTGFLKLPPMKPKAGFYTDPQGILERALLLTRK